MIQILQEIFETNLIPTPNGEKVNIGLTSIDRNEAEFLLQILLELKPSVTLEIGLAYGISAMVICSTLENISSNRHIIIDPYQSSQSGYRGIGLFNLQRAGFERLIEFHETFSYIALPQIEANGQKIDFAFIDGCHTFDFVLVDFFYIDKILREGGIVVFDDADWPAIRKVIRFIVTNLSYSVYKRMPSKFHNLSVKHKTFDVFVNLVSPLFNSISRIPGFRKPITRAIGAELLGVDKKFGLKGSCIALRKNKKDERRYDYHIEF